MKTGKQHEAIKLINEATEIIEKLPDDDAPVEQVEILQEMWEKLHDIPGRPEEVTQVLEKIEARSKMNGHEANATAEQKVLATGIPE